MSASRIRVAVVGGGLAGTLLTNALGRHSHLDVQLYEAKAEFQERGASVGLSVNAQRALRLLGSGLKDVTRQAGAVKVGCLKLIMGEGIDEGQLISEVDFGKETVHRAALLRELLVPIDRSNIHFNKSLSTIDDSSITFTDGTIVKADVIVGADGIHSRVRHFVLGAEAWNCEGQPNLQIRHPRIAPVPSGFWDTRTIVPYHEALTKLGPSCIDKTNPHQHIHIGRRGIILHDFIDDGDKICIVASGPVGADWDVSQWTHTVTRGWLEAEYKGWGNYGKNALDLLFGDKTELPAFLQWESANAPTLYKGTICMIGDAAHACSPWQGSGLSQAIEDSLILDTLLGRCHDIKDIPCALEIFDRLRREHAQAVVDSSRKAAEAYFSAWPGGAAQLRREIPSREYILDWDTEGAVREAIDSLERYRAGQE